MPKMEAFDLSPIELLRDDGDEPEIEDQVLTDFIQFRKFRGRKAKLDIKALANVVNRIVDGVDLADKAI